MTKTLKGASFIGAAITIVVLGVVGVVLILQGVSASETKSNANAEQQAMPVEVAIIEEQAIRLWKDFSGHLTAVDYVEIRPQVTGLITDVKFEDGQLVSKGDILYIIDPRPLKAAVDKAEAELMVARNRYTLADKEYKRAKDLIKTNVISQRIYDERMNTKLVSEATVKSAAAQLSEAEINLGHAYVRAPVSGRVSRAEITEGNLVSAGPNAPLLTAIVSSKNIYADFEVDEQTYLRYVHAISPSRQKTANKIPVELRLQSDELMYRGKIHAFDNRIDRSSGTIRARAIFDNPENKLLPGMYVRLRLGSATEENRILVSERAIGTDQNRKFVYVVNAENKTTYREVQLGDSIDGDRIVRSGLTVGDKVIIRGLMRIRPNMLVEPKVSITAKKAAAKS
ncbi:efflux RND transporter periplasmic adaptor subunit [Sulfuriflexus mobilis]|uniref:efflux RND transporter periplasmic adaptor subunit n=1 Tax=Sulfuriflexus mobilis TaxID=1811807 RepID=UPI0018D53C6D|nr:efflux RND transporter periplasmic adaptor subunit [Sulfuriflexus mobilis]